MTPPGTGRDARGAPPAPRPRLLAYCQSLVGIGHLSCTLRIVEALLPQADVDLIHGGLDAGPVPGRPGLRTLRLATLLHDEDSGAFYDPEGRRSIEAIWTDRAQAIDGFLRGPYDAVLLEFYPFGRRRFKHEIGRLLADVAAARGPVPVFTSVREVLIPRPVETERRMVESVKKHIHTVFVRSDPAILRLDETFSLAHELGERLCHTGYIGSPPAGGVAQRKPQVLVSQGGGAVGRELLLAAIGVAPLFPALNFVLAAGARSLPDELAALQQAVCSPNVEIHPFLADFPRHLAESALSISMGGDNTLLEVLAARTPALAYPYQGNSEQGLRIRRFAERGLLHELSPEDLVPQRLQQRIAEALAAPLPPLQLRMDGARVASERMLAVVREARAASRRAPAASAAAWGGTG